MDWVGLGRWWIALALALATGCAVAAPDEEEERPSAKDDPRVAEIVAARCAEKELCGCEEPADGEACHDAVSSRWQDRVALGDERGLTFDPACLDLILTQVGGADCERPGLDDEALCRRFCAPYHGDLPEGASCEGDDPLVSNCAQGLTCADGTCTAPCEALVGLREGEACRTESWEYFDECGVRLYCDPDPGVCARLGEIGEPCGARDCVEGAYCDYETQQCLAGHDEGSGCRPDECVTGLYCHNVEPRTCEVYAELGESCDYGARCAPHLSCNEDAVCTEPADAGGYCTFSDKCAGGHVCDLDAETCLTLPITPGEPCADRKCGARLWCDTDASAAGVCTELAAHGEPCTGHDECESGLCPTGHCAFGPKLGEDCSQLGRCGVGLVCNGETCQATRTTAPAACVYEGW